MSRIPFLDLKLQDAPIADDINAAVTRVLESGWFLLGEEGRAFEREWSEWLGVDHTISVASGTDALQIALMALGVGNGDEVITVANTCVPTVTAIRNVGATPVLVDVSPDTLRMDPSKLLDALTERTRAIVPVHLYGHPCDMEPIQLFAKEHGLRLVEDCAQAHGAMYKGQCCGTFGDAAAFSFYPSKNLGAYGDAGAVVTNDDELAGRMRKLRVYGESERYHHELEGMNSRMDEIQAAVLRAKLPRLHESLKERRELAGVYREHLDATCATPLKQEIWAESANHLFVVQCADRNQLQESLRESEIDTLIHYPIPIHLQAAYEWLPYSKGDFSVIEAACERILSLPLYPGLSHDSVRRICDVVNRIA